MEINTYKCDHCGRLIVPGSKIGIIIGSINPLTGVKEDICTSCRDNYYLENGGINRV